MLHYKAFSSAVCNNDVAALEGLINEWLAQQQNIYVQAMAQSAHGEHLVVSFLYEENEPQGAQRAAVATATRDIFEEALREAELEPADELLVTLAPHAELPY